MDKKTKRYLDSLPDDLFFAFLFSRFGGTEIIWEEVSEEEYFAHELPEPKTIDDIWNITKSIFTEPQYRKVPHYRESPGILVQLNGVKPDYYTYEKQVGTKSVICLGNDLLNYCKERECCKELFKSR